MEVEYAKRKCKWILTSLLISSWIQYDINLQQNDSKVYVPMPSLEGFLLKSCSEKVIRENFSSNYLPYRYSYWSSFPQHRIFPDIFPYIKHIKTLLIDVIGYQLYDCGQEHVSFINLSWTLINKTCFVTPPCSWFSEL